METGPDPADRRRTIVRPAPAMGTWGQRPSMRTPIDADLTKELRPEVQGHLPDALAALDLLARLLVPEVVPGNDP